MFELGRFTCSKTFLADRARRGPRLSCRPTVRCKFRHFEGVNANTDGGQKGTETAFRDREVADSTEGARLFPRIFLITSDKTCAYCKLKFMSQTMHLATT